MFIGKLLFSTLMLSFFSMHNTLNYVLFYLYLLFDDLPSLFLFITQ